MLNSARPLWSLWCCVEATLFTISAIQRNNSSVLLLRGEKQLLIPDNIKRRVVENLLSLLAGDKPPSSCCSVDFEPPSAEGLKQNWLVLFSGRNRPPCALCNESDILVVVCSSAGSVCFLLWACVEASVCFQERKSSVWMVCRPCAGLWGVDCGVLNHSLLMLCLGIWLWCVPLCLRSLNVSLCL